MLTLPRQMAAPAAVGMLLSLLPPGDRGLPTLLPAQGFEPRVRQDDPDLPAADAEELRRDALASAKLWGPSLPRPDLGGNPKERGSFGDQTICKFYPRKTSGHTPKFDCVFEGGEVLKVKYGRQQPEVYTEVAATRLLRALGAGSDRAYFVKKLRCFGCPQDPQVLLTCISTAFEEVRQRCQPLFGEVTPAGELKLEIDYGRYVDFEPVAIERRAEGDAVETKDKAGWGWDELDQLQSSGRGATRAERDALRLMAVFLNHWDNKSENQRLLCLPGGKAADGRCRRPFAYINDVGGTFGRVGGESKAERKLDLEGWRSVPIWKDAPTCRVAIDAPLLHGATFGEATITESGRRFLAGRLRRLTRSQIRDLFEGSHFADFEGAGAASRDVGPWVDAFEDKVRQIAEREPCIEP
jgi:hypothetical protein